MGLSLKKAFAGQLGIFNFSKGIGGFLNDLTGQTDAASQSYKYDQLAANADMQRSIKLWNMQNEYNTPAAQIARLAAAGIDVNPMTYAVGSGNMNSTASNISAPSSSGANMGAHGINPVSALMSVIGGISSIANQEAQTEYIRQQTRALDMTNDENEVNGTSNATPYPVRVAKQVVHETSPFRQKVVEPTSRMYSKYVDYKLPAFDNIMNFFGGRGWNYADKSLSDYKKEYQRSLVKKKGYR